MFKIIALLLFVVLVYGEIVFFEFDVGDAVRTRTGSQIIKKPIILCYIKERCLNRLISSSSCLLLDPRNFDRQSMTFKSLLPYFMDDETINEDDGYQMVNRNNVLGTITFKETTVCLKGDDRRDAAVEVTALSLPQPNTYRNVRVALLTSVFEIADKASRIMLINPGDNLDKKFLTDLRFQEVKLKCFSLKQRLDGILNAPPVRHNQPLGLMYFTKDTRELFKDMARHLKNRINLY